jgi:hypothetical protein
MPKLLSAKILVIAALLNPATHFHRAEAAEEAGQPVALPPVALRQAARPAVLPPVPVAPWDRQMLARLVQAPLASVAYQAVRQTPAGSTIPATMPAAQAIPRKCRQLPALIPWELQIRPDRRGRRLAVPPNPDWHRKRQATGRDRRSY